MLVGMQIPHYLFDSAILSLQCVVEDSLASKMIQMSIEQSRITYRLRSQSISCRVLVRVE